MEEVGIVWYNRLVKKSGACNREDVLAGSIESRDDHRQHPLDYVRNVRLRAGCADCQSEQGSRSARRSKGPRCVVSTYRPSILAPLNRVQRSVARSL